MAQPTVHKFCTVFGMISTPELLKACQLFGQDEVIPVVCEC